MKDYRYERRFRIGDWSVRPDLRELSDGSTTITIEIRAMDVLVHLAQHGGDVVARQTLLDVVWKGNFVTDEVLSHCIWELRKALGDDARSPRFIKTVPRRGYQLVAEVSWLAESPGKTERYELETQIGSGGMGVVWRASDTRLRRTVALKFLPPELSRDTAAKDRFLREARAAAKLDHPNICTLHEVDESDDGRMFLVMPCYRGETLKERLARGPLAWPDAIAIAAKVAMGLSAAHDAGIVHRDVKPGNIMLTEGGEVKILDFGIAKLADKTRITLSGSSLGTPSYMSPEQARGEDVDARSDLWSLGVVLYEAIAGTPPFVAGSGPAVLLSILNSEPPSLADRIPGLPGAVQQVVDAALTKSHEVRIASARDLLDRLALCGVSENHSASSAATRFATLELDQSPYPGLAAFTRDDRRFFFGRDRERDAVWGRLARRRMSAIIGPSGVGKSSFLRAGLLPAEPNGWRHVLFHPGPDPLFAFGEAIAPELAAEPDSVHELLRFHEPDVALRAAANWRARHGEALVAIDQFEELFTLNGPETQAEFTLFLQRLVVEAGLRVLLSMRDDFLFRCHGFPELAEIFTDLTPIGSPTGEALRETLVEPALRCGYTFEEGLVEEMLAEVGDERGALPLLAFTAARLWECRDRDRRRLSRETYEDVGRVSGALAAHAESVMLRIGPSREPLAREIFRNLLSADGTRAARSEMDLLCLSQNREVMSEVLAQLVNGRLLTTFEVSGQSSQHVEIIHESLLVAWPRLARWLTQEADGAQLRDQLRRSAMLWEERRRPRDLLWTGASWLDFQAWRSRYTDTLTPSEEAFATAMTESAGRKRRRALWATGLTAIVLLVVLAIMSGLWLKASSARHAATEQARRAEAAELVALGQLEVGTYPSGALAYALASLEMADQPAARRLVLEATAAGPPSFDLGGDWIDDLLFTPDGEWLVAGGNGGTVVAWPRRGGPSRQLARFERSAALKIEPGVLFAYSGAETLERRWTLPDLEPLIVVEIDDIAHSWDGSLYGTTWIRGAAESAEGTHRKLLQAWPLEGGEPQWLGPVNWDTWEIAAGVFPTGPEFIFLENGTVYAASIASGSRGPRRTVATWAGGLESFTLLPGGQRLLAPVEGATRLALWSLTARTPNPTLIVDAELTIDFYHAAGDVVVMANSASHTLRVHSLVDGRPVGPGSFTAQHALRYVELSADGAHLAAGSFEDSTVFLFDLEAPPETRPTTLKRGSNIDATSAAFHPDGTWLATGDVHGAAIWPLSSPLPRVIAAHDSRVTGVAFAPDGSALASASLRQVTDGRLRLGYLDGRASRLLGQISSNRVAYGPGPDSVLLTGWRGVHLVDLKNGDSRTLPDSPNSVSGVAIDAEGKLAAAAGGLSDSDDSVIRVWDLIGATNWPAGERRLDAGDLGWVVDLAFLPDGSLLAASEAGLQQWDVEAGTFDWLVKGGAGYRVLGVDRTGRIIATVAADFKTLKSGAIRVWDRQEGTSWEVTTHDDRLMSLAVSPDGKHLISGDRDGVVRIGPVTGEEPHLLLGHQGTVWDLDVSPDGQFVASAGNEGDLRLWPMAEGPPAHTLPYEDFVGRLRSLTNLRVLSDESFRSGYRVEGEPNPGWSFRSSEQLTAPENAE